MIMEDAFKDGSTSALVAVSFLTLILTLCLTFIGMAASLKIIEQAHIDRRVGMGEALGVAASRFFPLLVVSLLFGLIVGVGLLVVIPGIIFLCMFAFAGQVVVLENYGPVEALSRSSNLTAGFRWRIFGIYFLTGVLTYFGSFVISLALNSALPTVEIVLDARGVPQLHYNHFNHFILVMATTLVSILFSTYATICLTLAYFDLRTRKEGFDLELAARGLAQKKRRRFEEDDDWDDDDRPRRRRDEDDEDDDRPRRRRDEDDEDDDRPRRRKDADDDDRPRRRRDNDDEDDDRPRRRRDEDDEDDDRPRRPRRE